MRFIDTHTHVYLSQFDEDRAEMVDRCLEAGVEKLLLPNIDVASIPAVLDMMKRWPEVCHGMMGLHPCDVDENWESALAEITATLDSRSDFIAVGEIGIDLYWDKTHLEAQKAAFKHQCELAKSRNLPIAIHVRDAWSELFDCLDEVNDDSLKGVFHCFTGDNSQASRALEYGGFMLGIGGVSTYKNGGLDKVLPNIPLDHLILETDSPYLSPTPHRGKRNESSYIPIIAQRLADIKSVSLGEVAAATTANAERLFKI